VFILKKYKNNMKINTIQILYFGSLFNLPLNSVEGGPVPQNMQQFNYIPGGMWYNMNSGMGSRMDPMNSLVASPRRINNQANLRSINPRLEDEADYGGPIEGDYGGEIKPNEKRWRIGSFLYSTGSVLFIVFAPIIDTVTYFT
jgi:hypothetical protein